MKQNTSHAVMSQRHEPKTSLDDFPTPPWATRALCEWLVSQGAMLRQQSVWEPACGRGDMARVLAEYFADVAVSDVADYELRPGVSDFRLTLPVDFLDLDEKPPLLDWIVTNPPFKLAEKFASLAVERADLGAAMLVRTAFLEGTGRHSRLFSKRRPTDILQFSERVPMVKGRLDPRISTATSYCWLVWTSGDATETQFHWLPPCRKALEKPGDYPEGG